MTNSTHRSVRAAVLIGPQKVAIETFPLPEPGRGEIIIRVEMAGLDGTDVKRYNGDAPPGFYREDQLGKTIPSDEAVGTVVAHGDPLPGQLMPDIGDRVVVEPKIACGQCWACVTGESIHCVSADGFGLIPVTRGSGLWGGCSEYMVVPVGGQVHPVSKGMDARRALLCAVVLPDAVRWIDEKAKLRVGESVAIVGVGPQGLSSIVAARHSGAGRIVAVGTPEDASRLELALELGADEIVVSRPGEGDITVREATVGGPLDVIVECSGHPAGVRFAWDAIGKLGRIVQVGLVNESDVTVPITRMVRDEITVLGGRGPRTWAYQAAAEIAARTTAPLERIVSHTYPLDATEYALQTSGRMNDVTDVIKVAVDCTVVPG